MCFVSSYFSHASDRLFGRSAPLFHFLPLCIFISDFFPSSSIREVFLWAVARCTRARSDARTRCVLAVWAYQNAPSATSRRSLRQLCVPMCVVLWRGVWCAQSRVIIWWWPRDGKTGGLRSSGHAARPQPANQRRVPEVCKVQRTHDGTLRYSVTHRPHQKTLFPKYPGLPEILVQDLNQREPLVSPSGKSTYLWTKWDVVNHTQPRNRDTLYFLSGVAQDCSALTWD